MHAYNQMLAILAIIITIHTVQSSPAQFDSIIAKVQPPLFARKVVMGHTVNQNQLFVYLLTKKQFVTVEDLYSTNAILINSYMHARQPYSVDLIRVLLESMINSQSQKIDYFLSNGVFILFPFVNIDGYNKYMQSLPSERDKIRKNMNVNSIECGLQNSAGVDINRNFPSSFGVVPQSSDPCSEQYHGIAPFSEKQAMVFKQLFERFKILIALDLHSYGNEWIYPYASDKTGNKVKQHPLYPFYEHLIEQLNSRNKVIQSCIKSLAYIADGVYIDWALDQGALSLAYEVGTSFNADDSIQKSIRNSIQDFWMIFQMAVPNYKVQLVDNTMIIRSLSLCSIDLVIALDDTQRIQKLTPGNEIQMGLNKTDLKLVQIRVVNSNKFNQIIHNNKDSAYLYIVVIFLSISIAFALMRKYCDRRGGTSSKRSGEDFKAINIEEQANISLDQIQISKASAHP